MKPVPFPLWDKDPPAKPMGFQMNQNRMAVPTWSYAFEVARPTRILELGSASGGLLMALGIHAYNIGASCYGFDLHTIPNQDYLHLSKHLPIHWNSNFDIFTEEGKAYIKLLIQHPGTTYVLSDNGRKADEFNTFAPFLKPGDIIGVHDYKVHEVYWGWGEVTPDQISGTVNDCKLKPFLQDAFDMAAWLVYRKEL